MEHETSNLPDTTPAHDTTQSPWLGISQAINQSFSFAWNRLDLTGWYLLITVAIFLPFVVAGFTFVFSTSPIVWISLFVVAGLVSIYISMVGSFALLLATLRSTEAEPVRFPEAWRTARPYFWSLAWVGLLVGLAAFAGFLLLIIPALIVAIYCLFYMYALADEDARGMQALCRSTELVRGHWWQTFGRFLVILLVIMIVSGVMTGIAELIWVQVDASFSYVLMGIGLLAEVMATVVSLFVTVVMMRYVALMFQDRTAAVPMNELEPARAGSVVYSLLAGASLVLLLGLSVLIATNADKFPTVEEMEQFFSAFEDPAYDPYNDSSLYFDESFEYEAYEAEIEAALEGVI